jgi:hypothetical protein
MHLGLRFRSASAVALAVLSCTATLSAAEDFKGKDLPMRDFSNKPLDGANFEDANLFLAKFVNASLAKANFQGADLTSASFSQAKAAGADFRAAIFKATGLQSANFSGANFQDTDLGNSSFQNSNLAGANLRGAKGIGDVQKADLRGADLRGAVFTCTAYYMEGCRLKGAKFDQNTKWPAGFDFAASGAMEDKGTDDDVPAKPETKTGSKPATPRSSIPAEPKSTNAKTEPGKAPKLDGEKLTEEMIKHLLETEMWAGKDLRRFKFNYKSLKLAAPRPGKNLQDIASGKPRTVTPVRVQVEMIKSYDNNETKTTEFHQDYEFFRDEFGTWTYRFQGNL